MPPNPKTATTTMTTMPTTTATTTTTTTPDDSRSQSKTAVVSTTTNIVNAATTTTANYYTRGSIDLAVETPVLRARLERRREGTHSHHGGGGGSGRGNGGGGGNGGGERLLVVLVGLPARGKSYVSRKLAQYLMWRGNQCRIFNVGKYRRAVVAAASPSEHQDASFFDDTNHQAVRIRQEAAQLALTATLEWLDGNNDNDTNDTNDHDETPSATFTTSQTSEEGGGSSTLSTSVSNSNHQNHHHHHLRRLSYGARRHYHRVAIFDATNSTQERRRWILQECAKRDSSSQNGHSRTGVLFLESLCDDEELLRENYQVKIASCPDFDGMTADEALKDLQARIDRYTDRYETVPDQDPSSYIKIFNLGSRLMVNHVYGRLAKVVLPAIMAWNTGSRPIYLVRSGETQAMEDYMLRLRREQRLRRQQGQDQQETRQEDDEQQQLQQQQQQLQQLRLRHKSDRLGSRGFRFRDALCDFIAQEGTEFMAAKNRTTHGEMAGLHHPCQMETGTSISGLYEEQEHRPFETYEQQNQQQQHQQQQQQDVMTGSTRTTPASVTEASTSASTGSTEGDDRSLPFPCLLMSSTLPRAVETATWERHPFPIKDVTNLNPIDMGDFAGMDLDSIREQHPVWYHQLERDPYNTRDLIDRLWPVVIDLEQTLGPAVVISHVSVLQVLLSYFRAVPVTNCTEVEVPMHTVFKFVPLRGGGWLESRHVLLPDDDAQEPAAAAPEAASTATDAPEADQKDVIWGDSRSCLPHRLR